MSIINSYYNTFHKTDFDMIDTDDEHIEYTEPYYKDDSFMLKTLRNNYVQHIENWFNTPIYNHKGYLHKYNINQTDNFYNNHYNNNYDYDYNYDYEYDNDTNFTQKELDDLYYYDDTNYSKLLNKNNDNKDFFDDNYIYNRDICKTIFYDLENIITSNGYIITDINQFKEDLIYFIYRLSKL